MTRRPSGTGSVYQRADGLWCQAIELPNYGGKRRRKVIARKSRADLTKAVNEARRELAVRGDIPSGSPTLARWLDTWLEKASRDDLKPRTAHTYRGYVDRYLVPTLGKTRIDKLTPGHVDRLHAAMLDGTLSDGKPLSTTTALQAHRILARALAEAKRRGLVAENVATLVTAPSKAFAPRPALTAAEARALLLSSAAGDPMEATMWAVLLLGGLREGEMLGLTRDAVTDDLLTVEWQVQRLTYAHGCGRRKDGAWPCGRRFGGDCPKAHLSIPSDQEARQVFGGLWLTRPKSRAGWREVPVCPPLAAVLTAYLKEHAPGAEGLIFHREDGRPLDPSKLSDRWHAALAKAGVRDVPMHSARHTCNTLLASLGTPVEVREAIMGHSSAAVNLNYTHAARVDAVAAMGAMGELVADGLVLLHPGGQESADDLADTDAFPRGLGDDPRP